MWRSEGTEEVEQLGVEYGMGGTWVSLLVWRRKEVSHRFGGGEGAPGN